MELRRSDWWKACKVGWRTTWKKSGWSTPKGLAAASTWAILFIGFKLLRLGGKEGAQQMEQELNWAAALGLAALGTFLLVLLCNTWRAPMQMFRTQRALWNEELRLRAEANKALVLELAELKGRPSVERVQGIFNHLIFWGWGLDQDIEHERLQFPDSAIWRWAAAVDLGLICLIDKRFLAEHMDQLGEISTTDRRHLVTRMGILRELADNLQLQQIQQKPDYEEMERVMEGLKECGDVPNSELPLEIASLLLLDPAGPQPSAASPSASGGQISLS